MGQYSPSALRHFDFPQFPHARAGVPLALPSPLFFSSLRLRLLLALPLSQQRALCPLSTPSRPLHPPHLPSSIFHLYRLAHPNSHPFARDADALYQLGSTLPPLAPPPRTPTVPEPAPPVSVQAVDARSAFRPFDLLTPARVSRSPCSVRSAGQRR
jgi:hypothetical protein